MTVPSEATRRKVACPSCGAPVRFRGATSVVAVCAFCRATLVREGVELEDIGKQAELLEDHSPLRIGADGRHRGAGFTIVGRIQYRYESGVWNEWHVLFGNGRSAWLSDAAREYTITYLVAPQPVPAFDEIRIGQHLAVKGEAWFAGSYTVLGIERAEVIAGEGELPFRFESGWKADVVDLRGEGARFATIDYSETPPHLYAGEKLPFDTFGFAGLRDPEQVGFTTGTARAFKCTGCGAPVEKRLTTTETVACGSCGTVTDVTGEVGQLVQKNELNMAAQPMHVPLGAIGTWKNVRYEVVGFMRRGVTVDGLHYAWSEYLLHNVERGYAWLVEYDGHWNFVHTAAELPKPGRAFTHKPTVKYLGHTFTHFQHSLAEVTHVRGEFYWRVKVGEQARCDDYVDPPLMLSRETTGKEMTWSLGEYVEPQEIWKAFKLTTQPPKPRGVAPNQPSPHKGKAKPYWLAFLAFVGIAFAAQLGFLGLQLTHKKVAVPFRAGPQVERTVSPVFQLGGFGSAPLTVSTTSSLQRQWMTLNLQLTHAETGQAYSLRRQLGFHSVGGQLEGSASDVGEFPGVPAGRYTLAIEAHSPESAGGTVQLHRSSVGWSNLWLLAGFLVLWPVIATARAMSFEQRRWAQSDYATASGSDDSDD